MWSSGGQASKFVSSTHLREESWLTSLQAHVALAGGDQEIQGLIKKCLDVADVDLVYLPLTRYGA